MIANYGYKDGSGEFFIIIDTDKCNGCGDCVEVCPADVLAMAEDEFDPLGEDMVAVVVESHRKKIKYSCNPCKGQETQEPCIAACDPGAISHSF